ncbi:MAG TPA: transcription elongation factor GreB [Myxococcota bacterium]|nr:transcription elongation factor GreB [Myxococcota bacterium]
MPSYITPAGYRRIVEEYDTLLKVERPRMTAEVAYAASLGDRSENAEYIYGKKRLREIDRRLRYLSKRIESIEVVDPAELAGDVVRFSATVVLEDEDGEEQTLQIVGEDEIDPPRGRISYKSPIGRALIGKEEGDEIVFSTPGGKRTKVIIEVSYR